MKNLGCFLLAVCALKPYYYPYYMLLLFSNNLVITMRMLVLYLYILFMDALIGIHHLELLMLYRWPYEYQKIDIVVYQLATMFYIPFWPHVQ